MKKVLKSAVVLLIFSLIFCLFACENSDGGQDSDVERQPVIEDPTGGEGDQPAIDNNGDEISDPNGENGGTPDDNPDPSGQPTQPDNPTDTDDPTQPELPPAEKSEYNVYFYHTSGALYHWETVKAGEKAVAPADPKRAFDVFSGWKTSDGEKWVFDREITSDIDLFADWQVRNVVSAEIAADSAHKTEFEYTQVNLEEGLKVDLTLDDGTHVYLGGDELRVEVPSEDNDMRPGKYNAVIKTGYGDIPYEITVNGIEKILIDDANIYADGDVIDINNIVVDKVYTSGKTERADREEISVLSQNGGGNTVKAADGKDTIIISVAHLEYTTKRYEVDVYDVKQLKAVEIDIYKAPKLTEFAVGGKIDDKWYDGISVRKRTEIFGDRWFFMEEEEYKVVFSVFDVNVVSDKYIAEAVALCDESIKKAFSVAVVDVSGKLTGISVSNYPTVVYRTEALDLSEIVVRGTYENGGEIVISAYRTNAAERYDSKVLGTCKITVSAEEDPSVCDEFSVEVIENPVVGIYYDATDGIPQYAVLIAVNEEGDLKAYEFSDETSDWTVESTTISEEMLKNFVRTQNGLRLSEDCEYLLDEGALYFGDIEQTWNKLGSDDVLLFIYGYDRFFFVTKKGKGFTEEELLAMDCEIFLDEKQEHKIGPEDVFTENTTVYIEFI